MSDSTLQFTNHACLSSEYPFMRSSGLHSPPSHTKGHHVHLGPSTIDYHQPQDYHQHHQHHQQHASLGLQQPLESHSLRLETFENGLQLPSTHGLGLLPMPVAYEDFQYALPAIEPSDRAVPHNGTGSSDLQASNPDSVYQTYPHTGCGTYGQNYQLSFPSSWSMSPASRDQLPSPHLTQDLSLNNFLHDALPNQQSNPSASIRPPPSNAPIESNSRTPNQIYSSNQYFHEPSCVSAHNLINYPPPNPPTPPPLFDASEQDLLSSFLNILGDSNGECDFDPQGMPEGMPVLGELKRRLEECGQDGPVPYFGKRETDEMGREVESRLKISEPEYSHMRRPSLQSFQTTSGSLSSSSDSHIYQEQGALSRKKAKTSNTPTLLDPLRPVHIPEVPHHHGVELEPDVEMHHAWNRNPCGNTGGWPSQLLLGCDPHDPQPSYPHHGQTIDPIPTQAPSVSPVFPPDANGPLDGHPVENKDREDQQGSRRVSKRNGKPGKSTHMVSEQRRRNAIQGGFGSLVEILRAGEAQSGISIATPDLPSHPPGSAGSTTTASNTTSTNHNKKPKTRGRGRRGEIETGASKSVVLERAAEFVKWMADGNLALFNEINRVQSILQNHGIQV
ncbi:hypothetical protein PGT21_029894 [Puccinia graminis f. sp. tritici]|uniref:BHLH domain-containing protein n=2 Tax=Puccinia graminis f. sp. tritici TaxID=56615 RepID=A0A5B0NPN5_PUCGR|nr:hypothetical protein PGTUg99_028154 [Puccinia graminis f. sp. tritici]KAA1091271.1 hypothetical protein PGT21_029894 [Puccinia graminis f. sp. tritici]